MLGAVYIAAVVVLMDLTAVNIALPEVSHVFGLSATTVSWLLLVSMITASGFALVAGRFIELYNARMLLVAGFLVFGCCSFLSFLSSDYLLILVLRFVQGFAESVIYVIGPALIRKYLPVERQQGAYGIWMMCTGIGISMGPFLGGFLVEEFGWNYVFLINVPLCAIGFLFSLRLSKTNWHIKSPFKFDTSGALLSFIFITTLILGINMIKSHGGNSWIVMISLSLSIISLLLFVKWERKIDQPLFDLGLFRVLNFSLANLGFFLFFLINVGSRFLRPFYFEDGRGLETSTSGLLMTISPLIMIFVSPFVKYFVRFVPVRFLCITGNLLLSCSMFMFALWNAQTSIGFLVASMIVLGAGMGLYYPSNAFIGMISIPEGKYGMASASISTSKSSGKMMGVLLFGVIFTIYFPYEWVEESLILYQMKLVPAFQNTFVIGGLLGLAATIISVFIKRK